MVDRKTVTVARNAGDCETMPNRWGSRMSLRITCRNNHAQLTVSTDKRKTWQTIANDVDVSQLHHNRYGQFLSLRIGLIAAGQNSVTFSHFTYKSLDN